MDITRIDSYTDSRFSKNVLNQHGAYLVDDEPYQIEITDSNSAVIQGKNPAVYKPLIEEFRFHAPHISRFYDEDSKLITAYPTPKLLDLPLDSIQPSQFFIDQDDRPDDLKPDRLWQSEKAGAGLSYQRERAGRRRHSLQQAA